MRDNYFLENKLIGWKIGVEYDKGEKIIYGEDKSYNISYFYDNFFA